MSSRIIPAFIFWNFSLDSFCNFWEILGERAFHNLRTSVKGNLYILFLNFPMILTSWKRAIIFCFFKSSLLFWRINEQYFLSKLDIISCWSHFCWSSCPRTWFGQEGIAWTFFETTALLCTVRRMHLPLGSHARKLPPPETPRHAPWLVSHLKIK